MTAGDGHIPAADEPQGLADRGIGLVGFQLVPDITQTQSRTRKEVNDSNILRDGA